MEASHDSDSDSSAVLYSDPDIDDLDINGFADPSTMTPLMRAARSGNMADVQNALRRRYHVNTANNQGFTALHFAVFEEHVDIVRLLLKNDEINVDAQDWTGMSALMHACERRASIDILKCLLEANCNIHLEDNNQLTALWYAVLVKKLADSKEFDPDIIDILTKHGAHINVFSAYDETPISYVMSSPEMHPDTQEYVAAALLYYGADPSIKRNGFPTVITRTTNARLYEMALPYYRIDNLSVLQHCNIHTIMDIWRMQSAYDKRMFAAAIRQSDKCLMRMIHDWAVRYNALKVCARNVATMRCDLDCLTGFVHELYGTEELYGLMFSADMGREMQSRILSAFSGDSAPDLLRLSLCNYNKLLHRVYCNFLVKKIAPREIIAVLEDFCLPINQCRADLNIKANIAWRMYLEPPCIFINLNDKFAFREYFSIDVTKPPSLLELCRNTILNRIKSKNQINKRNPFGYAKIIKSLPCPQLLKDILLLRKPLPHL